MIFKKSLAESYKLDENAYKLDAENYKLEIECENTERNMQQA
jgi:hypothetical protein